MNEDVSGFTPDFNIPKPKIHEPKQEEFYPLSKTQLKCELMEFESAIRIRWQLGGSIGTFVSSVAGVPLADPTNLLFYFFITMSTGSALVIIRSCYTTFITRNINTKWAIEKMLKEYMNKDQTTQTPRKKNAKKKPYSPLQNTLNAVQQISKDEQNTP